MWISEDKYNGILSRLNALERARGDDYASEETGSFFGCGLTRTVPPKETHRRLQVVREQVARLYDYLNLETVKESARTIVRKKKGKKNVD